MKKTSFKIKWISSFALVALVSGVIASYSLAVMTNDKLGTELMYQDSECLMCHSAPVTSEKKPGITLKAVGMEQLGESVHKELHCVQCHKSARLDENQTHMTAIDVVECTDCHYEGNTVGAPQKNIGDDYSKGVHADSILADSASLAPHCWDCHTGHTVKKTTSDDLSVDRDYIVHICTRCHYDKSTMDKYNLNASAIIGFEKSPHEVARLENNNQKSAICTDCHGNHNIKNRHNPDNPLNDAHLPETCGKCHEEELAVYKKSIHGKDWLAGNKDVPVCSTCHGEHEIRYVKNADATVSPSNVVSTCLDCHEDVALRKAYGITANPGISYRESYHGIVNNLAKDVKVANCSTCHGFHDILPQSDPESSVNPANLGETCGECHEPAVYNAGIGKIHIQAEKESSIILFYVKYIYILVIVMSMGGMCFYIFTDLFGFVVRRRRALKAAAAGDHSHAGHGHDDGSGLPDDIMIERWPVGYRFQHFLLVTSFTVLVLTGAPLVFPEFILFKWMASVSWLYELRGVTHRVFGFIMIAMCAYHVIYIIANRSARKDILNMIPKPRDGKDAFQSLLFNLTLSDEHPRMPRYNFIEKFEYGAMVWGSFVMVASGLVLTFNSLMMKYMPMIGFDIATLVHKFEAILATLAIIVWHMYTVHLTPDFFPMNKTFLTGKISLGNIRKHHGEEYEEIKEELMKKHGSDGGGGDEGADAEIHEKDSGDHA